MTDKDEDDQDEEEGNEEFDAEEYLGTLETCAVEALQEVLDTDPGCVNAHFVDPDSPAKKSKHAWGRPQEAARVPVPAGFEGVTALGEVILVCPPQGVHMPHLGTPHASTLVIYQEGFACQTGGKDIRQWRFDEVTAIQSNLVDHGRHRTDRAYTLSRQTGESLILDDGVKFVQAADYQIKLAMFKRLADSFLQRYEQGETLTFGPVSVQQRDGLRLGGRLYAWEDITDIKLDSGELIVTLGNKKSLKVRTNEIPNLELLGRLIGLDDASDEIMQEYYSSVRYD